MDTLHFDRFPIAKSELTPSGLLRVTGAIAKVGDLPYLQKDGSVQWEQVSPETLFDPEHIKSIQGLPVTLDHPPEPVTPDNYSKYAVGSIGETVVTDEVRGVLEVLFTIGDKSAIQSIQSGKTKELSMGYWATTEPIDGKPGWFRQTKRVANHVSLVKRARGGPDLRLALDAYENYSYLKPELEESVSMAQFTRDGVTFEFSEPQVSILRSWFDKQDSLLDEVRKELTALKNDSVSLTLNGDKYLVHKQVADAIANSAPKVELEKLQVQLDAITSELESAKDNKAAVIEQLKKRRALERKAASFLKLVDKGFNEDSFELMDDRGVRETVIVAKWSHFDSAYCAAKSDEAIAVLFDLAVSEPVDHDSTQSLRERLSRRDAQTSNDAESEYDKAQKDYADYLANSWEWVQKGK